MRGGVRGGAVSAPSYSAWLIAEQFNERNAAQFEALAAAGRLAEVTFCQPSGRIERLTMDEARSMIAAGRNVYADIGQTEGEWLTGREVTA
jgi:hypothetical protein